MISVSQSFARLLMFVEGACLHHKVYMAENRDSRRGHKQADRRQRWELTRRGSLLLDHSFVSVAHALHLPFLHQSSSPHACPCLKNYRRCCRTPKSAVTIAAHSVLSFLRHSSSHAFVSNYRCCRTHAPGCH